MVDQEVWQTTRAVNMFLQDGYQLVHPQKLDELIEEREDQRARIQQLQTRVQNAVNNSEEKWKKLIQETAEKERENVRNEMLVEQEEKMSQLQAQWVEALSEKEAVGGENGDFLSKYQTMLEEQLEIEKANLRLQLEEEHSEKLRSLESSWRATLEENEQLVANSTLTQQDATGESKWKSLLEEAQKVHAEEVAEKDRKLEAAEVTLTATMEGAENLRLKMEEAETTWKMTVGEMEERLKLSAETVSVELGDSLQGRLEQEKEALRAQMAADREEELAAVETTWKATLHDVEERAQREKDDIQVLLGEGEALKQKVEEIEAEKQTTLHQLEEEGQLKLAEVEAKWQEIFREATGKAVHVSTADDAKAVIAEIEAGWIAKLEEKELEHGDRVRSLEDAHLDAKQVADAKLVEQDIMVNKMLQKLEKLETREVDVREKFNTSAEKVESQLRPLRQKEVCTASRDVALGCYSEHSGQPLRCSQAVKKFMECVDAERIALLQRSATSV